MILSRRATTLFLSVAGLLVYSSVALISQNSSRRSAPLIRQKVDENKLVTLAGNTRSEANAENDLGPVGDALTMDHMLLQLKRPASQQQAAAQFVADLHNPKSPNFHKWMTAAEFGRNFGVAESDIQTITAWLRVARLHRQRGLSERHGDRFLRQRGAGPPGVSHFDSPSGCERRRSPRQLSATLRFQQPWLRPWPASSP